MEKLYKAKYFLLSFSLAFFVLSVLLLTLMSLARPGSPETAAVISETDEPAYTPDEDDALSVLFVGVDGDGQAGMFILARFDPARGRVPVAAFPPSTAVQNKGNTESLAEVFRYGGAGYAGDALAKILNAPIDRWVVMSRDVFVVCAAAIGAAEFDLPEAVTAVRDGVTHTLAAGTQLLDGQKAADIIGYEDFSGGELERCRITGELAAAIIDQRRDICGSVALDSIFEKIINLISTNISFTDFDARREAAECMAKLPESVAMPIAVSGSYSQDGNLFHLSDTLLARLSQTLK